MKPNHASDVEIKVDGDTVELGFSVLKDLSEAIELITEGLGQGKWYVSGLELGSYCITASPVSRETEPRDILLEVIERLASDRVLVSEDETLVRGLKKLGEIAAKKAVKGVSVGGKQNQRRVEVPKDLGKRIELALEGKPHSVGSVVGSIQSLTTLRGNVFRVVDEFTGESVEVSCTEAQLQLAHKLFSQRVYATGLLERSPQGKKKKLILWELEADPVVDEVSIDELIDAFSGVPYQGNAVDLVRELRDA